MFASDLTRSKSDLSYFHARMNKDAVIYLENQQDAPGQRFWIFRNDWFNSIVFQPTNYSTKVHCEPSVRMTMPNETVRLSLRITLFGL